MKQTRFDFGRTFLIGIGAQKAATTWLTSQLELHPDVHVPRKEIHYWDRIRSPYRDAHRLRETLRLRNSLRGRLLRFGKPTSDTLFHPDPYDHSGYVDFFRRGYAGQGVLHEFTPAYATLAPKVFEEMAALHDDVRFLILLRDPVSRLWSGVKHFHGQRLRLGMPDAALYRAFEDILDDPEDPNHRRSDYARLLSMPVAQGPRVHIDFFETIFAQENYDRVLDFAGLAPQKIPRPEMINTRKRSSMALPDELTDRAVAVFAPSYKAVRARFGDAVPERWRA